MKSKKKMLLALGAMSAAAIGAGATSTFAWYTASAAAMSVGTHAATGTVGVTNKNVNLGNLKVSIAVDSTDFAASDTLVITDRAGKTYHVAGDNYTEILTGDTGSTTGDGYKQGKTRFNVDIKAYDNETPTPNQIDVTADMLAAAAAVQADYYVKVTASGSVKISATQTTALGTGNDGKSALDPATETAKFASGALGAGLGVTIDVMKISISSAGVVSYWTNAAAGFTGAATGTWSITTVEGKKVLDSTKTAYVYYGLEVKEYTAEATPSVLENSKLTPDLGTSAE